MFAESFGVETRVLLLGGGELLPSYEQVCPATVCASQDAHEVIADLASAGFELAITNTAPKTTWRRSPATAGPSGS